MHDYSFEDYVGSSGPKLKRMAFLLTGDLTEAEALLQSVYAKVMPHWGKVSRYDVPDGYMRCPSTRSSCSTRPARLRPDLTRLGCGRSMNFRVPTDP